MVEERGRTTKKLRSREGDWAIDCPAGAQGAAQSS